MSKNNQRSQKAGAKAAKRRQVVAEKKRLEQSPTGMAALVSVAAQSPFERCVRTSELFDVGIGHIIVTKRLPSHVLSCAFFLVDAYCLGVKDVYHMELSLLDFAERFEELQEAGSFVEIDPACARKILRGSVAFAAQAGLRPAKDYTVVEKIFGDIVVEACSEDFVFGKEGKPFYVAGPRDTSAKIRDIVTKLGAHYGEGEWNYTIPLPSDDDDDFLSADGNDDAWLDEGLVIEHEPNPK